MDFKRTALYCLLNSFSILCTALKREFRFQIQSNSGNLNGLACAVSKYDSARGVMFDPVTKTCIVLNNAWFRSPSYDPHLDYFLLESIKKIVQKTETLRMDFPSDFVVGGSVILYMTTKTVGTMNGYKLFFKNQGWSVLGFNMSLREYQNSILYNTYMNRTWGAEERKTNPFKTSNKVYKLEFEITATQVKTYIDDLHFYSYNHRTSVENYRVVNFDSTMSTIDQIQFTYPN